MPQLFLSGWLNAYPGSGRVVLEIPDGCTNADVDLTPRATEDSVHLTLRHGINIERAPRYKAPDSVRGFVWIEWDNTADRNIPVDYDITPLGMSPDEDALMRRRKQADSAADNIRTPRAGGGGAGALNA